MTYSVRQNASPNFTPGRSKNIDKIIVHHAATMSFDGIGATFKRPSSGVSAHYGVGTSNNVDQYVQEKDTAWHAGITRPGVANPNPSSIGIENVNITGSPVWAVSSRTIDTLVDLIRDIAKRNGLFPVKVGVNLFEHSDFGDTYCAGRVGEQLQDIARRVNEGAPTPPPKPNKPDQVLNIGEKFQFKQTYRVDDMAVIGGIWQVRTNKLCPKGFAWNENGIPVDPLVEVAGGVGNSKDQALQIGSKYKIPGTYTVLNLGQYQGIWLAEINMGGWRLWVDVATVTEV